MNSLVKVPRTKVEQAIELYKLVKNANNAYRNTVVNQRIRDHVKSWNPIIRWLYNFDFKNDIDKWIDRYCPYSNVPRALYKHDLLSKQEYYYFTDVGMYHIHTAYDDLLIMLKSECTELYLTTDLLAFVNEYTLPDSIIYELKFENT